jgi:chemotaxis protein MotA
MKPLAHPRRDVISFFSLLLIGAIVILAQLSEGGRLRALLQPTAALVVLGGTAAALLLSFPVPLLRRTWTALGSVFRVVPEAERALVARFERYAVLARRRGVAALENDFNAEHDPFLKRALGLLVDGVTPGAMKEALGAFSRAREEADEECALVIETAAGYAPTLGILGAVLGLIRVMESLATPAGVGAGIAVAFVATVYGVGSANLLLLPLASRLRSISRNAAVGRELIIEGVCAVQQRLHPRVVEAHLAGFIRGRDRDRFQGAA